MSRYTYMNIKPISRGACLSRISGARTVASFGYNYGARARPTPALYYTSADLGQYFRSVRTVRDLYPDSRSIGNSYYTDDERDLSRTTTGLVIHLGRGRWLAGYRDNWGGMETACLSEAFDYRKDAAYAADDLAQRIAEREREYCKTYGGGDADDNTENEKC